MKKEAGLDEEDLEVIKGGPVLHEDEEHQRHKREDSDDAVVIKTNKKGKKSNYSALAADAMEAEEEEIKEREENFVNQKAIKNKYITLGDGDIDTGVRIGNVQDGSPNSSKSSVDYNYAYIPTVNVDEENQEGKGDKDVIKMNDFKRAK
jgi:hypothetical protein